MSFLATYHDLQRISEQYRNSQKHEIAAHPNILSQLEILYNPEQSETKESENSSKNEEKNLIFLKKVIKYCSICQEKFKIDKKIQNGKQEFWIIFVSESPGTQISSSKKLLMDLTE